MTTIDIDLEGVEEPNMRGYINALIEDPTRPYSRIVLESRSPERVAQLARSLGMPVPPPRMDPNAPAANPLNTSPVIPGMPSMAEYWTAYFAYYKPGVGPQPGVKAPNEVFGKEVVAAMQAGGKFYDERSEAVALTMASGEWNSGTERQFYMNMRDSVNSGAYNAEVLRKFGWLDKMAAYFAR